MVASADCSQRGADRGDDDPAERYGDERAEEAGAEQPSADPSERQKLERQWDRGDNVTTEDLRQGLRRYRSFFSRLLKV